MSATHEPTAEQKLAATASPAFTALSGWLQMVLTFLVGFLPQLLTTIEPAVAQFIAAHLSLAQAQVFAKLGEDVLALKQPKT